MNTGTECPPVKKAKGNEGQEMAIFVMQIFPEACPDYLRELCGRNVNQNIEAVISLLLETEYPKRQVTVPEPAKLDLEEQLELIKQILPNADPDYLFRKCDELIDKEDELKKFIDEAIMHHNYPTKADYLRLKNVGSQQKQYTSDFKVENFLQVIPNPTEYFKNKVNQKPLDYVNDHYKLCFLRNVFRNVALVSIRDTLHKHRNLLEAYGVLQKGGSSVKFLKTQRKLLPMPLPVQDIPLLQEMAYIQHYSEIMEFIKNKEDVEKQNRLEAKASGLLQTCECCFDDEIMPNDIFECTSKCQFCKSCILKYVEITFATGKCEFKCMKECSSHFSLRVLQDVIPPTLFNQIVYQNQISEIKSANIEDLEMCPFCQFAAIPSSEDKIFRCLNPDCMKETCRLCKEPSHIPLRCEEVEKDADVQVRTYIENKMTKALIRTCWKCKAKFIKSEGCNRMTCSCGALMCYLCQKPVKDYTHFNGPEGPNKHLLKSFQIFIFTLIVLEWEVKTVQVQNVFIAYLLEIINAIMNTGAKCPPVKKAKRNEGQEMARRVMQIFPEACPDYLRELCGRHVNQNIEAVISLLLDTEYPKRQVTLPEPAKLNLEEQLELIKQILPNADPDYLFRKCDELIDKEDELKKFIDEAIMHHNYPTKADYLRLKNVGLQQKQYTSDFKVENFLQVIPNPTEYFKNKVDQKPPNYLNKYYKLCFLRNVFRNVAVASIRDTLHKHRNLLEAYRVLQKGGSSVKFLKTQRKHLPLPLPVQNIPLSQEMAYIQHYSEIMEFIKKKDVEKQIRLEAKASGLLQTCECCFDDEIMSNDIFECTSKCQFCKSCILKYVEITFATGKCEFKCMKECSSHISLRVLQDVIPPTLFNQIVYQNQISEIKSANIEGLEMCPFCQFAAIPSSEDKIFRCLNPDCMKETCRLCKEPSHIPLRCEEVEKDSDVQVRTYIENKMTEALIRTCWKCKAKFVKSEGCNKMTCSCGALMCYLCRKPVKDYTHFNGPGGPNKHLCPLFNDINEVHKGNVIQGAQVAKKDVASSSASGRLLNDPTVDIVQHYKRLQGRKKNTVNT